MDTSSTRKDPLTRIAEWYRRQTALELLFKFTLTLEIVWGFFWIGIFVWFESIASTSPGMLEARLLLLHMIIGHAAVPATLIWAVGKIPKGKLKWLNVWWLIFALVIDIAVTVDAFIHLPHAPTGVAPDHVRGWLMAFGVFLCCLATFSIVIYVIAMHNQDEPTAVLVVEPQEAAKTASITTPLMYMSRGGGGIAQRTTFHHK